MDQAPAEPADDRNQTGRSWLRFSIKSVLVVTALVAVYLGGRASHHWRGFGPEAGTWQLTTNSGKQRNFKITALPDDKYLLNMGSNSTLGGVYVWKTGQLVVETPTDKRYRGLIWQRNGDDFVLIAEPPSHPAGSSYVGARIKFVSPDMLPAEM
jgi:hypothetical protein